ncbi:MAG: HisA/HisF-related TIM barrel protein [Ilumatobacteraceae bacterium]
MKRLIFTLLYDSGYFMLSRNFRLQRVGDINWLKSNYNFERIGFSIDELILLNVSRSPNSRHDFCNAVASLNDDCFAPIAAGGWITNVAHARELLSSGADKVVVNTQLVRDPNVVIEIARDFGAQCIVASIDVSDRGDRHVPLIERASEELATTLEEHLRSVASMPIGEIYLTSVDRDGTGDGYDADLLRCLPTDLRVPLIIAGGVGMPRHLIEGLAVDAVDAVATAHLHNFVGDGLSRARLELQNSGFDLPTFSYDDAARLRNSL